MESPENTEADPYVTTLSRFQRVKNSIRRQ